MIDILEERVHAEIDVIVEKREATTSPPREPYYAGRYLRSALVPVFGIVYGDTLSILMKRAGIGMKFALRSIRDEEERTENPFVPVESDRPKIKLAQALDTEWAIYHGSLDISDIAGPTNVPRSATLRFFELSKPWSEYH